MLWILSVTAYAQKSVSGTVSDPSGSGIPGVSVAVKGSTRGTVTDGSGKFSIEAEANSRLVFSSIGYVVREVSVGSQSII
ncbi:MAG: carboxypeptidase-like regulatory domain-containing protein, partial [Spirosomataceae bacterium]